MKYINRMHDEPLRLDYDSLNEANLDEINFHRCCLNDLDVINSSLRNCLQRSKRIIESI